MPAVEADREKEQEDEHGKARGGEGCGDDGEWDDEAAVGDDLLGEEAEGGEGDRDGEEVVSDGGLGEEVRLEEEQGGEGACGEGFSAPECVGGDGGEEWGDEHDAAGER